MRNDFRENLHLKGRRGMNEGKRVAEEAGGEPTDTGAKCQGDRKVQGGRTVNSVKSFQCLQELWRTMMDSFWERDLQERLRRK